MKYKIIALMGKAGSGKDTVLRKLMELYPDKLHEIVSCTTRPPREGEKNGINYYFLTVEEFTEKVLNGDMIEATMFNDWHYGTMKSALDSEKWNIGVFNPDGIRCLQEDRDIELVTYWISACDKTRLIRQLEREENPDIDEIIRRFKTDKEDFNLMEMDDISFSRFFVNETPKDLEQVSSLVDRLV